MHDVLLRILELKREEVRALKEQQSESAWCDAAAVSPPAHDFEAALKQHQAPAIIAEFKRRSPSKGDIRADANPAEIARAYERAGAAAVSVLTDESHFGGSLADLRAVRRATALPLLRKDFTIDPVQIFEARAIGADAILLIVAALDDAELASLHAVAISCGMSALVEVHSLEELERAQKVGARLIGVNNRDLHTFKTDVNTTRRLFPEILKAFSNVCVVTESGLKDAETVAELSRAGVDAFLIGEALMRSRDPGAMLKRIRGHA